MLTKISKDKRRVATADKMIWQKADHPLVAELFFFPRLSLSPPVMFEHMAGTGLGSFLDRCRLVITDTEDCPGDHDSWPCLRYVHGRSEAMRGEHEVTSVLLALQCQDPTPESDWIPQLTEIYQQFLSALK